LTNTSNSELLVRVPIYHPQSGLRHWLKAVEGFSWAELHQLYSNLNALMGTPKNQVDWTDPDSWIGERLSGKSEEIARSIWQESQGTVNPRHSHGCLWLSKRYGLLQEGDTVVISDCGHDFISQPLGKTVRWVDEQEGLLYLLGIVAERGQGQSSDFLPAWSDFLRRCSKWSKSKTIADTLRRRLSDLADRELLCRSGNTYSISEKGLSYLSIAGPEPNAIDELRKLIENQKQKTIHQLSDYIASMNPIAFEGVIQWLLEKMGYQNVERTPPSGDGGVDVVAEIELGITSVREVVQVKRKKANIQRKDLDALRGCLHRFKAVRGTLITTGDFAKGTREASFEPGAAPITLINGDKLVELLIQHRIGVRSRPVEILEFDQSSLEEQIDEDDDSSEESMS